MIIGEKRAFVRRGEGRSRKARVGRAELHGYAKEHHGGGRNYPC